MEYQVAKFSSIVNCYVRENSSEYLSVNTSNVLLHLGEEEAAEYPFEFKIGF
jgi:hypothetical protein